MRKHFAAFLRADQVALDEPICPGLPPVDPVPPVPQKENGLGNSYQTAAPPTLQAFPKRVPLVPFVPHGNDQIREAAAMKSEEHAAILEYDKGLTREEAERLAAEQLGLAASPAIDAQPAPIPATYLHGAEYDALLNRLIDAACDDNFAARLRRKKAKGEVIEADGRSVYTMGRF